jgi:hypothetical protein
MNLTRREHKMSLTISITTPEGIVLAADSRQTYKNMVNASRIGSDSATKIFAIGNNVGVTVAGPAFLLDPNDKTKTLKSIGWYINEFQNQIGKKETVETITNKLRKYLEDIYQPSIQLDSLYQQFESQITSQKGKIIKSEKLDSGRVMQVDIVDSEGKPNKVIIEIMPISLIISGYDLKDNGPEHNSYVVYIPGPTNHSRKYGDSNQFGADWTGQTDVVTRIIKGFDPRMSLLGFVQGAKNNLGEKQISNELNSLQYIINWGTMTLSDAVDIAKLMIETTSAVQRYSDGIGLIPGEIPGVGGPIDIAVILPNEGFHWHQQKKLNLEKIEKK